MHMVNGSRMPRFHTGIPYLMLLVVLSFTSSAVWSAPASSAPHTFTVPGAFKVDRPNQKWVFQSDAADKDEVAVANREAGIQILLHWVSNISRLDSKRATAVFESKLMRSPLFSGQSFSIPRKRVLVGENAYAFTVDKVVDDVIKHHSEYIILSRGTHCLVVVISGGVDLLDKNKKDVNAILESIAFVLQ